MICIQNYGIEKRLQSQSFIENFTFFAEYSIIPKNVFKEIENMSQAKVDRYKQEKANRKQIMKKEKAKSIAARTIGAVICVALVGWIGYSGYTKWESSRPTKTTEITTDALSDYLNGLSAEAEAED